MAKPKFIKDETTGNIQIQSTSVNVTDTDHRLVLGKPISGKVTVNADSLEVSIDIPKAAEPSDITKFYEGPLSGFRTNLNNKTQKCGFVFNVPVEKVKALGIRTINKEVKEGVEKMFEEIKS